MGCERRTIHIFAQIDTDSGRRGDYFSADNAANPPEPDAAAPGGLAELGRASRRKVGRRLSAGG